MAYTIRVSLPGYNALTDPNPDHYALYADNDNILIKEFARGSGNGDATITHNLGYIPFYLVYVDIGGSKYQIVNVQSPIGGGTKVYATTTTIEITNNTGKNFQYYIFYDNMS